MKVYQAIAHKLAAISNCARSNNEEWMLKHNEALRLLMSRAPSGSGIDCGTKRLTGSTYEKLMFACSYHHMNESGMYDGWTEHVLTVRPSLMFGFTLTIGGRDRNGIKDYLHEIYETWLNEETSL